MGEAKRRAAEIAELKKKPRERKRVKRLLGKAKTEQIPHFKNEAERRKVDPHHEIGRRCRETVTLADAVRIGGVMPSAVHMVELKICTPVEIEPTRPPQQPRPLPLVIGAKEAELAHYVIAMAQIARGNGFRQPSSKAKNWQSTSLLEKLAIAHLGAEKSEFKRSKRGEKKLKEREETKVIILLDRVIEQWPDRAQQAKTNERMLNWLVGKVEEAFTGNTNEEWRDLLRVEAQSRLDGRNPKYLHSYARDWLVPMKEVA